MKQIATALATIIAVCAQACALGLNGLTLISIPLTIFLGLQVIEKITEADKQTNI